MKEKQIKAKVVKVSYVIGRNLDGDIIAEHWIEI